MFTHTGDRDLIVVMPDGDDSWYTTWNALGNAEACRADTARHEPAASERGTPVISEIRRGFEIGFLVFLPFLVIDMVVASLLMSLGMMMLPPNAVSLPMKLIFFVLVDGWRLVSSGLVQGFAEAAGGG